MKRIGILTGGGDAPGLNAVIRAVVKTAIQVGDCEVLGIKDGFDGFILENGVSPLTIDDVRGILPRGGTILGTANRGNPFARKVVRDGEVVIEDLSGQIIENIERLDLHALVVVGGDGTLRIASELYQIGVPVVGVPKTIDNDINGTEFSFGFDTAVSTATEAIDKLHTTAESHHRVMVVELMGRDAGFITLHAGVAGGADIILIPEIPFRYEKICEKVHQRIERGSSFSIVAVAEGAHASGQGQVYSISGDQVRSARLGGIGQQVGEYINEHCQVEARVLVLGHLQRGGSPTAFDRWLATRYGAAAARLAMDGKYGRMVALKDGQIIDISLVDALAEPKRVDVHGDEVFTARAVGISFADE